MILIMRYIVCRALDKSSKGHVKSLEDTGVSLKQVCTDVSPFVSGKRTELQLNLEDIFCPWQRALSLCRQSPTDKMTAR